MKSGCTENSSAALRKMAAEKAATRRKACDRRNDDSAGIATGALGGIASVKDSEDMATEADLRRRWSPPATSTQQQRSAPALAASSWQPATSDLRFTLLTNVLHHPRPDTSWVGLPYVSVPNRLLLVRRMLSHADRARAAAITNWCGL